MFFIMDLLAFSSVLKFWFYFTNMSGLKKTHNENLSLTRTSTRTHTDTNTQHSSLLIALCSPHTTQLHGQIEAALIFLHSFLPTLLFFCNSKPYSGSHSGGQLTPRYFGYNLAYPSLHENSRC